ncbi:MAG: SUMF1/EgtB/PvdO family nonheme iron enzyme [Acidobacteria bacterium]|nr:SUMF1/EgtB/PvdO family nonheme iron enzyme [Acidobacteriota bacterium]
MRVFWLGVASVLLGAEAGMVFLPGGEFQRGRTYEDPETKVAWYPNPLRDDLPVKGVHIDPFYMDEHEVTIGEYAAFVLARKHRTPPVWADGKPPAGKEKFPVADVSWEDAGAYCAWKGKRLPTEAEWERACRGLAENEKYPWGNRAPKKADARFDATDGPVAVCGVPKNKVGLCDMSGNVWEWTADWYAKDYYASATDRNPPGPEKGIYRVLRGGSWFDKADFLTCAHRTWARPGERSPTIGFRCAKGFGKR